MKKYENLLKILIGNMILAFSVNMFILPFEFIAYGTTGLALLANHYFQLPFNAVVTSINVIMFVIGLLFLGKRFALTTLLSTMIYPVFLELTANVSEIFVLTSDPLVAAIVSGLLSGLALGLVIQSGASTGGMDIPPLILEKKYKIPVGLSMGIMDASIMLAQTVFAPTSGILCGLVFIVIVTIVMNRILVTGTSQFQVMVMSEKTEEMRDVFIRDLNRGVTMFKVETGYYHNDQKTLMSIVSQKDLSIVQETVNRIDDKAFMVISKVQEVHGKGFKPWKDMKNDAQ